MKYAHYFSTKTQKFVIISDSPKPEGEKFVVKGKHHARQLAAFVGAKTWNF